MNDAFCEGRGDGVNGVFAFESDRGVFHLRADVTNGERFAFVDR
jgi:hypothetical protein